MNLDFMVQPTISHIPHVIEKSVQFHQTNILKLTAVVKSFYKSTLRMMYDAWKG